MINETSAGGNDLITVMSMELLFSECTILHFAATTTDLFFRGKMLFHNDFFVSFELCLDAL